MRLTTMRTDQGTRAVRLDTDRAVVLDLPDVGAALVAGLDDVAAADGAAIDPTTIDRAPLITEPGKIVCVGVNYADHIAEMGRETPPAPTYFAKFTEALIGATDDIALPPASVSTSIDWEGELVAVIGTTVRNVDRDGALAAIAGFTVGNDVSVRDWQRRTTQFLAGKTFEAMSPLGPDLVTVDEIGAGDDLGIRTSVNGIVKQESNTRHLVFDALDIVADLSTVLTLRPGDVIFTGTPGGVGAARDPQEWLGPGDELVTEIDGIGALRNRCVSSP